MSEIRRVKTLAEDTLLLTALGEIVTIQIDLIGAESVSSLLKERFDDSEKDGLYIDNMILQRSVESYDADYISIFDDIAEITGEYESIDSVTALVRINYKGDNSEVTVQLLGNHQAPQLMQVTDQSHYFELSQLIQTRWQFARARF